ncbi:MAG: antitoxin [Acidimicrobiales bacterium]
MRTTVTLDADTEQLIRRRMRERRISFKQAVNDAIRDGLARPADEAEFRTETVSMGNSQVDLDRALQLAAQLEDDELVRKMRAGS